MAAGMSPIGLIIAGPIADKLGVQTWFLIGGIVTVLMGIISPFIPAIMHFEDGRTVTPPAMADQSALPGLELQVGKASTSNPVEVECT